MEDFKSRAGRFAVRTLKPIFYFGNKYILTHPRVELRDF